MKRSLVERLPGVHPFLPRQGVTPFVIVCVPRTGSRLLVELLDSHPEILCHTEVFNPKSTYLSRKSTLKIATKEDRARDRWHFLRRIYEVNDGARAVGFKIMPRHNDRVLLALLLSRSVRKIILLRNNWLEAYVSAQISLRTNRWHIHKREQEKPVVGATPRVHVDTHEFGRFLWKVRLFYRLVEAVERATRQRFLHVEYASLTDSSTHSSLLEFLGVQPQIALELRLQKQNTSQLEDRIDNLQEVTCYLNKRNLAAFLERKISPDRIAAD